MSDNPQFAQRLGRINDAIALKETDKIPMVPFFDGVIQKMYDSSYRSVFYDHDKATDAVLMFYKDFPQCDAAYGPIFASGKAFELAGLNFIDWPGRPGTRVPDDSSHQVIEHEYMTQDEYPELLRDFTGFILRKYIPRMCDNLKGLETIAFQPTNLMTMAALSPLYDPKMEETYRLLIEIGKLENAATGYLLGLAHKLAEIGMPSMIMGSSGAPYDILGDYFRGTLGILEDLMDHEDEIRAVCDIFADQQIQRLQYLRHIPVPGKRVLIPLHKGMDGFMNPRQYEELYWKPLKKIIMALIDMDVTPYIYTEGQYNTRLEVLTDVPKGKVLYHFENVDMKEAKRILGGTACIAGNLPAAMMEFGKKEEVINYCKYLIDTCAPGGGYIFDFNASLDSSTPENLDAMFETFETYR